jgi:hypothetical protein
MKNFIKKSVLSSFVLMFFVSQLKCMNNSFCSFHSNTTTCYSENNEPLENETENNKQNLLDFCKQLRQCLEQENLSDEDTISTAIFIWGSANYENDTNKNKLKPFKDLMCSDSIFFTLNGDVITTAFGLILGTTIKKTDVEKIHEYLTKIKNQDKFEIIINLVRKITHFAFIKKAESILKVNCYKTNHCIQIKNKLYPNNKNLKNKFYDQITIIDLGIKGLQYTHQILFLSGMVTKENILIKIYNLYQYSKLCV